MTDSLDPSSAAGRPLDFEIARRLFECSPHGAALGLELINFSANTVTARLPYREELVGNIETGHLHGGALTTLIDQTSGASVLVVGGGSLRFVTLDLRIDHLRPARPGAAVVAHAECYRVAREVSFCRCAVHEEGTEQPIANSMSAFMRLPDEVERG